MDFKSVVSATKSVSCSSFFLLLFTFYVSSLFVAQAARHHPSTLTYHVVNLTSLQPKSYCESHTAGSAFGSEKIKMASRNGPCAPHKRISSTSEQLLQTEIPSNRGSAGYIEYLVTIGLGKPKTDFDLLVDTGSGTTWVRCKPCTKGCGSQDHMFDPSKSSTYVNGPCRSRDDDEFAMNYGDESNSAGHWGCDTLTIKKYNAVKKFQFGCAQEIQDTDDHDGILGLGRGSLSLPSQGGPKFEKFCYCLPKSDSHTGYLVFGNEADKKSSSSKPQFTPLLHPPKNLPEKYQEKSYYFVELIGMSVAGKQLEVEPSAFTSSGTIIDSGTSITQLPQEAYSALTAAFNQSMASKYPAAASKEKPELHTCYNVDRFDTSKLPVPAITFRFSGGVNVGLKPSGIILVPQSEPNLVCLGFAQKDKAEDLTILGSHQQRQMGMFFDLLGNRVGFGTNNCDE